MVFIVVISSVLLAVCTSLKPIYLQNAIDAVDAGAGGTLTMFLCYAASILGILLFETARQLSTGKYRNSRLFSLKRKVMAHIVYMPPRKFQEEQGQNYVTTLNNEIEMLVDSYYVTRLELAYSILVLITCVIALLYINGYGDDHHCFHRVPHCGLRRAGEGAGKADELLYDDPGKAQCHDR